MKLSNVSRRKQILLSSVLTLTMAVAGFLAFPQQAAAGIPCPTGQYTVCGACQEAGGGFWKQWCTVYQWHGTYWPSCWTTVVNSYPKLCSP